MLYNDNDWDDTGGYDHSYPLYISPPKGGTT